MDSYRVDDFDFSRTFSPGSSRRGLLAGVASGLLAILPSGLGLTEAEAKRRRKKKKRKKLAPPPLNAFGCLDVGQPCRGNSGFCCSSICQGAPPKKGKPDTSVCVAHNVAGCTPERSFCATGDEKLSLCGADGVCVATTGNAGFCASDENTSPELNCRVCSTDADCVAQGFPPGSACAILTGGQCVDDNDCTGVNGRAGTACLAPGAIA